MNDNLQEIQKQRGSRYGNFSKQVDAVAKILEAMLDVYYDKHGGNPDLKLIAEWSYLAIKLARIPADPSYEDNYDDLSVYSQLIKENNKIKEPP